MSERKTHCIFQTGFIGDIALTMFLLEELRIGKPQDRIIFITTPLGAEIAHAYPEIIDEVIVFDKRGKGKGISGMQSIIAEIKKVSPDTILSLHQSMRSSLIIGFSGIPTRIGYVSSSLSIMYNHRFPYQKGIHEIDRQRTLLHAIDPDIFPLNSIQRRTYLSNPQNDTMDIIKDRCIVIAPGSIWETKKWPASYYKELIDSLLGSTTQSICLIGSQADHELCNSIIPDNHRDRVINLAGKMHLGHTLRLLQSSSLLIANDSAPIHLASLVNCPTIAIFGPTHPAFGFAPLSDSSSIFQKNLPCRPCSIHGQVSCPLGTHACMRDITPSDILSSTLNYLS